METRNRLIVTRGEGERRGSVLSRNIYGWPMDMDNRAGED